MKQKMYALLNERGQCSSISIPGSAGSFNIQPIFMLRKDADLANNCLNATKRKIVKVFVTMELVESITKKEPALATKAYGPSYSLSIKTRRYYEV